MLHPRHEDTPVSATKYGLSLSDALGVARGCNAFFLSCKEDEGGIARASFARLRKRLAGVFEFVSINM